MVKHNVSSDAVGVAGEGGLAAQLLDLPTIACGVG
jgi:hypothetical protein